MFAPGFTTGLPKAELHLHIEGTLEPDLMFRLATANAVDLPYADEAAVLRAYQFEDLQSFLDLYYAGAGVLHTRQDFSDLALAYLARAAADNVRHVEMFFDPQTHTGRGVPFSSVIAGLTDAVDEGRARFGVSTELIMCFLRHLPADDAMRTLEAAGPHLDRITAIGLDSSEVGHPPSKFTEVFAAARDAGLEAVAHAGEEGPPSYVWESLDVLGVSRIDHGVRSLEDPALVRRLAADQVPLTVCPLSNVRLRVVDTMNDHMLPDMLDAGLMVSLHSDDPAYFGGYIVANYDAVAAAHGLDEATMAELARNSIRSTFLPDGRRQELLSEIDAYTGSAPR